MTPPELWIIAGPNGARKTTCAQLEPIANLLPRVRALNPDDRTRDKLIQRGYPGFAEAPAELLRGLFIESAEEVAAELEDAIKTGECVCVETVLSTDKYLGLVEEVRLRGGFVGLIYITLQTPELAIERVGTRVQRGGHHVPPENVRERWRRSLELLPQFLARVSAFWVIDNSSSNMDEPRVLIARGVAGVLVDVNQQAGFPAIHRTLSRIPAKPA
jgi:predicted ABC-type ATPase